MSATEASAQSKLAMLYVTVPTQALGQALAQELVLAKLVACAVLSSEARSFYEWEGQLCSESEWILTCKTRKDLLEGASAKITELHPYACPCILSWELKAENQAYGKWVQELTSPGPTP